MDVVKVQTKLQIEKRVTNRWDSFVPYLFILPFIVSFFIFFVFPSVYSFVLSFYKYRGYGDAKFVGLDNYVNLLTYNTFWVSVENTLYYLIGHMVPVMIIAFLLAIAINSKLIRWKKFYKPMIFLPQVMSTVAAALVWKIIFGTRVGVINSLLGTHLGFLENPSLMKLSIVVLIIWRAVGWYLVIFLAGLTTIGEDVQEAATLDGTNTFQRLYFITIPLMKPIFLFAFLINTIGSLKIFSEPNLLVATGTSAPPDAAPIMNILTRNIQGGNFGMASAVGWLLFLMIFCLSIVQYKLFGGGNNE